MLGGPGNVQSPPRRSARVAKIAKIRVLIGDDCEVEDENKFENETGIGYRVAGPPPY